MKLTLFLTTCFSFLFSSCFDKKIEITAEYIINEHWDKAGDKINDNSIQINKLKVKKDSIINLLPDLNQSELLRKLEEDTSFAWVAVVKIPKGESYSNKKVFFNKDNGFDWWSKDGGRKTRIIGKLETNNWYEVLRLSNYYFIVYIDSAEKVHRFVINQANY